MRILSIFIAVLFGLLQVTSAQDDTTPVVAISPLSGPPGTVVDIIANGFPANTSVQIGVGRIRSEYDVVRNVETSLRGVVETQITIPDVSPDDNLVIVVETQDLETEAVSYPFDVTGDAESPSVTIAPLSGPPGTEIQIAGAGYPINSDILIGIGRLNAADFNYSLEATTNAQGQFSIRATIPEDAQPNRPWVALAEWAQDRTIEATSPVFNVTAAPGVTPTAPPDDTLFEQTDIYLIALGDAGRTGLQIGCEDSVVPVLVSIEPTVAPLTAAYERLFNADSQFYADTDLYNALYQSDLAVQGIDIDNGLATINLTGELNIGGACDAPRVRAQLVQTALQYATIDSVNIAINDVPLADLLSGA